MTARVLTPIAALCLLAVSAVSVAAVYDEEAAMKAIKSIAQAMASKKDAQKDIAALAKSASLDEVMHGLKKKVDGGFGVGAAGPGVTSVDGIEAAIQALAKRAAPAATVEKHAKDWKEMAHITQAIGELADHYAPKEKKGEKDPVKWKQFTKEMKEGAAALAEAAGAAKPDPKAINMAAKTLNDSCVNCHAIFR